MQPDEAHKRASLACASWREDHIGKKTPRSLILLRRLRYQSATPVLSFPNRRKNAGKDRIGSSIEVSKHAVAAPRIRFSASAGEVATLAARDLSSGLAAMLGIEVGSSTDASLTQSGIRIDADRLAALEPWRVTPAFKRRAFISDIMTWDYNFPDRLELHLRHDREFISWMARRGLKTFSYIRPPHDTP